MKNRNFFKCHLFLLLIVVFLINELHYAQTETGKEIKIDEIPKKVKLGEKITLKGTADIHILNSHSLWLQVCTQERGQKALILLQKISIKQNSKIWGTTFSIKGKKNISKYEITVIAVKKDVTPTLEKIADNLLKLTVPIWPYKCPKTKYYVTKYIYIEFQGEDTPK